jgi:hypothetical protein
MDFGLSSTQQALTVAPALLNSRDVVSFSLVLSGVLNAAALDKSVICDSRIKGIRRVSNDLDSTPFMHRLGLSLVLPSFLAGIVFNVFENWLAYSPHRTLAFIAFLALLAGYAYALSRVGLITRSKP